MMIGRSFMTVVTLGLVLACIGADPANAGAPAPRPRAAGAASPDYKVAELGRFEFESGAAIDNMRVTYVTHGQLNEARDNAVLVMHPFASDLHYADTLIGPGKALDPAKHFIIATDFIGNARLREPLTTGPTNSGLLMLFPEFTVRDSVNVEYRFVTEHLGLQRIRAALGSSWGAMKAYQVAVSYPGFVRGIVPIAGSPATGPQTRAVLRIIMRNIVTDAGWKGGLYDVNPSANLQAALTILVPWFMTEEYFEEQARTPQQIAQMERFWQTLWNVNAPLDARDVYYLLKGWESFDVGKTPGFNGDTVAALASIKAKTLLISVRQDRLVLPSEIRLAHKAIPGSRYVELDSWAGHAACCLFDPAATARINAEIAAFLDNLD